MVFLSDGTLNGIEDQTLAVIEQPILAWLSEREMNAF